MSAHGITSSAALPNMATDYRGHYAWRFVCVPIRPQVSDWWLITSAMKKQAPTSQGERTMQQTHNFNPPRVLPPAPSHPIIALEKREEAGAAPEVVARKVDAGARPARYKPALRLVAQYGDKFGAIIGLAAQRLVRDDDRGSR